MKTGGMRWSRRAVLIATVGGFVPAAGLAAHLRESHRPWIAGPTRRIEARLEHPRADVYKPFRVDRRQPGAAVPLVYDGLAELQNKGDLKGLADRLLAQKADGLASRV